ncbi:MAG: C1 family peptidase, partial [Liquorilactobacillus satsumensis]
MTKAIVQQQLSKFKDALQERPEHKVLERTITRNGILASAADYQAETKMTPVFSNDLDTGDVAHQKQSGRCWKFSALNTHRQQIKNTIKC